VLKISLKTGNSKRMESYEKRFVGKRKEEAFERIVTFAILS
jgi:hypothetical protein